MFNLRKSALVSILTFVAVGIGAPACNVEAPEAAEDEDVASSEEQPIVSFQGVDWTTKTVGGSSLDWGCGPGSPTYGPLNLNGFVIQGRVRCLFESFKTRNSDFTSGLATFGNLSSNETTNPQYSNYFKLGNSNGAIVNWRTDDSISVTYWIKKQAAAKKKKKGESCNDGAECESGECSKTIKKCQEKCGRDVGTCGCQQHETVEKKKKDACDAATGSCTLGMKCDTARYMIAQKRACILARTAVINTCFEKIGDDGHQKQIAQKEAEIKTCNDVLSPAARPVCKP